MPRIDGLLTALRQQNAQALLIVSGKPVCLEFPSGPKPVTGVPASTGDIEKLLGEIMPKEADQDLHQEGHARFTYSAPQGSPVEIFVESQDGQLVVRATSAPPSSSPTTSQPGYVGMADDLELRDDGSPALELDDGRESAPAPPASADLPSEWNDMFGSLGNPSPGATAGLKSPPPAAPAPSVSAQPAPLRAKSPAAERALLKYLSTLLERNGSDLHLAAGSAARIRVHGELLTLEGPAVSQQDAEAFLLCALPPQQQGRFEKAASVDFAYATNLGRFRANACRAHRGLHLTFRAIASKIPTLAQLGLPPAVGTLTNFPNGLILITGSAGCGKSSTQAALIDQINSTSKEHIITVEDPIEFIHPAKKCLVNQREVGIHARTFAEALRSALREDPDVILVGELRDLETMQLAITAAETGHLVLGTLHTVDAAKTIDRVIDVFPGRQKLQIRSMVSESLRGIVSQRLVPTADGKGRVAAFEVLLGDRSIANLIREGKTFQIPNAIRLGRSRGMCTMDESLAELARSGRTTPQAAMTFATNPDDLRKLLQQPAARPATAATAKPQAAAAQKE